MIPFPLLGYDLRVAIRASDGPREPDRPGVLPPDRVRPLDARVLELRGDDELDDDEGADDEDGKYGDEPYHRLGQLLERFFHRRGRPP